MKVYVVTMLSGKIEGVHRVYKNLNEARDYCADSMKKVGLHCEEDERKENRTWAFLHKDATYGRGYFIYEQELF